MIRMIRPNMRLDVRRAFTLIELLVVMGIIAILGTLTTLTFRGIASDARLASGKNAVAAVLDNARGLAMKNNKIVMVVFRPRLDGKEQYVEALLAERAESLVYITGAANNRRVVDRFVPIDDAPPRPLPVGVKIAGPDYGLENDSTWLTQAHLPAINQAGPSAGDEAPGQLLGVMFDPRGTVITRNSAGEAWRMFVDFDKDGVQEMNGVAVSPTSLNYFTHSLEHDESFIDPMPFIAVFDDVEARSLYNVSQWTNATTRRDDYREYITNNVTPMYFNRYTGVAMK